jgi:heme oxygenase
MDNTSTKEKEMTVADFALQLKTETKKSHTAAENTKFVGSFLRGVISKESYKQLVANFYFIYRAMEEEFEKHKESPILGPVHSKVLNRVNNLERDLRYYYGPIWRYHIKPTEQCQRYVDRIREVSDDEPELLIGHHYTRYMGDLSGGQILKGIAEKSLKLRPGEGLHFYEFEGIDDKKAFKEQYRATLNTIPINQSMANAIITEANWAFRLNMFMFDELQGNWFISLIKVVLGFFRSITNNWSRGK